MKNLYLIRGVSGSGKTTFAESVFSWVHVISADQYFEKGGDYIFDVKDLKAAHQWCQSEVSFLMNAGYDIAVANTFTTAKEMEPYYELADKYGYRVFSIIVENRHGNKDIHNVPDETLKGQKERFEVVL